ncbi:ComF family protein [Acuticoccus kandeliae]|uniref:ComF family protein n=1 Tax=Acuticoccus kandeliae TaxID=2073160 RepID=UPI000D3E6352|nr:double zinc ribbon domain-containing protein [Acuticoccus kandeliae]
MEDALAPSAPPPDRADGLWRRVLDALVPPICLGCRRPVVEPHALCAECWRTLEIITPPICPITGTPLAFDAGPTARSPELRWNHPLYDRARAATVFGPMSRRLVHALKYQDVPGVARLMARLMLPAIRDITTGADVLIPMPLHRRRLAARRFNQAVLLADAISGESGVPVDRFAVRRVRNTPRQVGLNRQDRANNLHKAFRVFTREAVAGKAVVVVDDVLTTGASADAIALTLQAAGARTVSIAVFSRVVGDVREPA